MQLFTHQRAKALLVVPALVAAAVAGVATSGEPAGAAGAAGGAWDIDTWGTPRAGDNAILKWDEQLLSTIRAYPGATGPTVTARALAVLHTATYDAWAAYDGTAKATTGVTASPLPAAADLAGARKQAVSYAAYRVLVDLFPTGSFPTVPDPDPTAPPVYSTPDVLLRSPGLGYDPNVTTTDPSTPAGVGNLAAERVLTLRHKDNSNQLGDDPRGTGARYSDTTGYLSKNTWDDATKYPWNWQPLCVLTPAGIAAGASPVPSATSCVPPTDGTAAKYAVQKPLTPQWGLVTPFGPLDPDTHFPPQFTLPGPPKNADGTYSTAEIDLAVADTSNLSDISKAKAEYWADGPKSEFPPGHLADFAQALSRMRGNSLDQDAKLFFALGNSLLDASISSWAAKYQFDFVRPTTAIRARYKDQLVTSWLGPNRGFGKVTGRNWQPYQAVNVVTPGFPEYVSGHSTFSAAGRTVLNAFFGTDSFNAKVTIKAGSSKIEANTPARDVVLSWKTLTAAADEAGWSRRYGGIHFKAGDEHGRTLGKVIGYNAWTTAQGYFSGTP